MGTLHTLYIKTYISRAVIISLRFNLFCTETLIQNFHYLTLRKPVGFLPRFIQLSSRRTAKCFLSLATINRGCLSSPFNVTLRSFILSHKRFRPSTAGHFHISLTHYKLFDEALLRERMGNNTSRFLSACSPFAICGLKSYFLAFSFCDNSIPRKLFMPDNYSLL